MRYAFVIDQQRCIGCHTCSVACRIENGLPEGVWWNHVLTEGGTEMDTPAGQFPNATMAYLPVACQHCENPACVAVCPVGATYVDPETGIVRQDRDVCIGCQSCIAACPYEGVRTFIESEPVYTIGFTPGDAAATPHKSGVVEKCTMCEHRIERGEDPMCVTACLARARFWGDLDDPESEVSKLLAERDYKRLNEEAGTDPKTFYLV